ncbi:hypothetical protein HYU19_00070 [Candidatus Woesearchaeota archaeon]|nr:hypothetical protein [Candidatus Woesearchaeota archaeon]
MPRGRPVRSIIRQRMVEILSFLQQAYGYEIYKVYRSVYPAVTLRSMYYHLRKGVELGEFRVEKIETTAGDYSWGSQVEKIVYTLGPMARPVMDQVVKEYLEKHPIEKLGKRKG